MPLLSEEVLRPATASEGRDLFGVVAGGEVVVDQPQGRALGDADSVASGQRGTNGQPVAAGWAAPAAPTPSASRAARRAACSAGRGTGAAAVSATVYGWRGRSVTDRPGRFP